MARAEDSLRTELKKQSIYFIGIGGIGMSAIARYMMKQGNRVYGYDKTKTKLTKKLESEGAQIHYVDDPTLIPEDIDLVVFTPAIPDDHKELSWFQNQGYDVIKRAEMLGRLSKMKKTIAVAGTHGKTSTSSMVAHILTYNEKKISAFIGGIMANYGSNYIEGDGDWIVVEADEYDRSFLWLYPDVTIVMSTDADHLDIYGEHDEMIDGFNQFVRQTKKGGQLVLAENVVDKISDETLAVLNGNEVTISTVGFEEDVVARLDNVGVRDGAFHFDFEYMDLQLRDLKTNMPGRHNLMNASTAMIACAHVGVDEKGLRKGLASFLGIERRFEFVYRDEEIVYIDDYAHHPTELSAAIGAARELFPDRTIVGIFQPHLYSRTRDFVEGFALELDKLDEVMLMDIYPARELPIEGVTSEIIFEKMKNERKSIVSKESLMNELKKKKIDVLMTLGAGDIDVFVPLIKDWLSNKHN